MLKKPNHRQLYMNQELIILFKSLNSFNNFLMHGYLKKQIKIESKYMFTVNQ